MRAFILAALLALPLTALSTIASAQPSPAVSTDVADARTPWLERHRAEILKVEPLHAVERTGKIEFPVLRGATVTLRPSAGMTAEWLQYTLNEHFASMAENPAMSMAGCPLALGKTHTRVRSLGSAFAVDVEGESKEAGEEILRRALAVVSP